MNTPALTTRDCISTCTTAVGALRTCVVLTAALSALASPASHADCSQIELLESGMDGTELALFDMGSLVDPGPHQRQIVKDAKGFFSPLQCHAVTRIAFVDDDGDGQKIAWVGGTIQDLLNISATSSKASEMNLRQRGVAPGYRANVVTTMVHEATHAADNLLNFVAPRRQAALSEIVMASNDWSNEDLEFARKIVQANLLDEGLRQEWEKLHLGAVQLGYAQDYHHGGDRNMTADEIIKMGVSSGYGGDEAAEDIAEMTSGIMSGRAWTKYGATPPNPPDDLVCERMRAQPGPGIPKELALIYTKVGLLNSVGLIGDLEYDYCVGNLKIDAPGNGFFTMKNNRRENAYTGDVRGTIGKRGKDDAWIFQLQATGTFGIDGDDRPGRIELTVPLAAGDEPRPSFPRGLFNLGNGGAMLNIYYTDQGEEKLGVSVESGVLLMSRASTRLVEGSIVVFRFINWTSLLAIPEGAGDMRISFRKKN